MAARKGLQARSFEKAASSFADAVGGPISVDSLARITEGFGQKVVGLLSEDAALAGLVAQRGESAAAKWLEEVASIRESANIG